MTTPRPRRGLTGRTSAERLDRGVAWALGLLLASFPLMLVLLAVAAWAAALFGIDLTSEEDRTDQEVLNLAYMIAVLVPLAASAVIGLRAWRRRGRTAGLVIAGVAALVAAGFVALPFLV
jgi:hypothetical protein